MSVVRYVWWAILLGLAYALVVVLPGWLYPAPRELQIAGGAPGGRFHELARALANELTPTAQVHQTRGAVCNLQLLQCGAVDLAFYQPSLLTLEDQADETADAPACSEPLRRLCIGVRDDGPWRPRCRAVLSGLGLESPAACDPPAPPQPRFVSNLVTQPIQILAGSDRALASLGKAAIGPRGSADHDLGCVLLSHLGLDVDYRGCSEGRLSDRFAREPRREALKRLRAGTVDLVIVSSGIRDGMFPDADWDAVRLMAVPHPENLVMRFPVLQPFVINEGLIRAGEPPVPRASVETLAIAGQLLASSDLSSGQVEAIAGVLHGREFLLRNQLPELYTQPFGYEFSRARPSFSIHRGAMSFYEPGLKPLVSAEFIDATEGIWSLVVGIVVAIYVIANIIRFRIDRWRGSRHEDPIRELVAIDLRQKDLDQDRGSADIKALQVCLDEVTTLRKDVLEGLKAYQMVDDPVIDLFLEMSHSVSEKISGKLSRQRLDLAIDSLRGQDGDEA